VTVELQKTENVANGYRRCLAKVVDKAGRLLREEGVGYNYDQVHAVKSLLYATIEQAGMETDRMISAQELLRELLTLVALQADPVPRERQEALRILEELRSRSRRP
jgi:hypothetical protein